MFPKCVTSPNGVARGAAPPRHVPALHIAKEALQGQEISLYQQFDSAKRAHGQTTPTKRKERTQTVHDPRTHYSIIKEAAFHHLSTTPTPKKVVLGHIFFFFNHLRYTRTLIRTIINVLFLLLLFISVIMAVIITSAKSDRSCRDYYCRRFAVWLSGKFCLEKKRN